MMRLTLMARVRTSASLALFAAGVALVFPGLSSAQGFTIGGMIASATAIAALLYCGAVWFGGDRLPAAPHRGIIVFDRALHIVAGAEAGAPLTAHIPPAAYDQILHRCAAVLAGESTHFTCQQGNETLHFDAVPVRTADGAVTYGILITGAAAQGAAERLTTVA